MSTSAATLRRQLWRTVFRLNGGLRVHGALPPGGCVVVANHSSHADAPAILAALDGAHRPVVAAAADYWFDKPLKAWVCSALVSGFPVRRDGGGFADLAARGPVLRSGGAVVVFPAGSRRSADGRFHQGAFRLAQECSVPVVPVKLTGTAQMLSSGRPVRRARVTVDIAPPLRIADPVAAASYTQELLAAPAHQLAAPAQQPPAPAEAGMRARLARIAAAPAGLVLTFCWAVAEGLSWPVMAELLIAALVLSGPIHPLRTALRLAGVATLGSAVGGVVTLLLARHGVFLPQPLTTASMQAYARTQLHVHGLAGLWSQPRSGVPYKVYARAAGRDGLSAVGWFAVSVEVRVVRLVLVAILAAAVQRATRRWQHLYTKALAAGLLTFVVGLCLVVTAWSGRGR